MGKLCISQHRQTNTMVDKITAADSIRLGMIMGEELRRVSGG